jgi:hypothetical protein
MPIPFFFNPVQLSVHMEVRIATKVLGVGVTGRLKEVDGLGSRRKASCLASRNRIRHGVDAL